MPELASNTQFRLPGDTHRTGIFGRTGSGKTRLGTWLLSNSPFDKTPYVVIDYKLEKLFAQADRIKEIGFDEVPKKPGLYIIRPLPTDDDAVEAWLWKIHQHENCGIYVDEGYGIDPKSKALRAVLTQGRSKHLPVIYLSQRPAWISPFVVSEADFLSVFQLTKPEDQQRVAQIMPRAELDFSQQLPEFHSRWYDVGKARGYTLAPVPDDDHILNTIDVRLAPKKRML